MRLRHIIQRGNTFSFVCRVPKDLRHLFPTAVIWKPIKASGLKNVRLLAGVLEQRAQKLFLELRTGMLSREMEKSIINEFLYHGVVALEARATGQPPSEISKLNKREIAALGIDQYMWESWQRKTGLPDDEWQDYVIQFIEAEIKKLQEVIIKKDTSYLGSDIVPAIIKSVKIEFGTKNNRDRSESIGA
jgi:hypothetical protein